MNETIAKKLLLWMSGLALALTLSGCGNTMYGFGLDLERAGRRLQNSHDPNKGQAAAPSNQGHYNYPQAPNYNPQAPQGYGTR